ncbi:nitrogenase-stabilizing/protective protein NifW [Vibrio mangrovi]|uniref:Nitrogenase-stabilizing/protective protein NifW n=1 Tax=Vibrio mangrovi TaxID=474394 RepID=A0A1Y6INH2_9VIBR|nr:nitrogenase-stabilizing/protective protein NifW [Vibrio mangrovi]MDW6003984.1 nitrogenase-stabilizing/protective protein NifW [Vibrio mangrovi]SMR99219.1 hypothetical protein VIM7927_00443 [Vibrio mangrovi]
MNRQDDFRSDLAMLETAEDILHYFAIGYDDVLVQRKHVQLLRLFHKLLSQTAEPGFDDYRRALLLAYQQISLGREPLFNASHCLQCNSPCDSFYDSPDCNEG